MYLVITTIVIYGSIKEHEYTHFIDLSKSNVFEDIDLFVKHLEYFKGQKVLKVESSKYKLGAW